MRKCYLKKEIFSYFFLNQSHILSCACIRQSCLFFLCFYLYLLFTEYELINLKVYLSGISLVIMNILIVLFKKKKKSSMVDKNIIIMVLWMQDEKTDGKIQVREKD